MLQRSVTICILLSIGFCHGQYAAQRQPPASTDNGIPAWYHMAKQNRNQPAAQASPSYFEREQNYESRREQPTYERPGIQTNQYANYPSYQNRQTPYENLNALTAASSLNQIQSGRRYPSAPSSIQGQDVSRNLRMPSAPMAPTNHHHPGRVDPIRRFTAHKNVDAQRIDKSIEEARAQIAQIYDNIRALYFVNQFVDWKTLTNLFLSRAR